MHGITILIKQTHCNNNEIFEQLYEIFVLKC